MKDTTFPCGLPISFMVVAAAGHAGCEGINLPFRNVKVVLTKAS
jgi:hypothetical protein